MQEGWNNKPHGWEDTHDKYRIQHNHRDNTTNIQELDLIIVMAGGLDDKGQIHPWVKNRLDTAIDLYEQTPKLILCTGGGTYHKPPLLNKEKFVIHESTACAEYLIANGVKSSDVIKEWASYDSLASVYFCMLLCVIPRGFKKVGVITSNFHMKRVSMLFKWIFGLHSEEYKFMFIQVKDIMDKEKLQSRNQREKNSVQSLKNVIKDVNTLTKLNKWLYSEHKAYSCSYLNHREPICNKVKESY